ncbi:Hypothetical protein SRAE_2000209700 [Strongyloides ratti]|uniref:Uncharacterized protein n=1 Tax=Strongyloides ratti TaxID=34506 RepID=A0A090LH21_STRRB|nr:Hypothetical protein SRAE_2000209700 [Strongyloides ratti]CEF67433.1 Hypothetical protein SRAE_2000209700 [Strongyloides ratti]
MTDSNTETFYSSSNSILEHMMSEYNKNSIDEEPSIKEDQFQRTIDILSIDVNKTLNNGTKSINNLSELPTEDKHSIDLVNEENNTISKLNLNKNIEKGDSKYHFTQTKDLSSDKILLNEIYSSVDNIPEKLPINTKLDNYLFTRNNLSEKNCIEATKMKNNTTTLNFDKKITKPISILPEFYEKKNFDSPISTSSLFLSNNSPTDSQSSPDIDEYDFECLIVENNNISTSLESINDCEISNSIQKSQLFDNNTMIRSMGDESVNYYNLESNQSNSVNNLIFEYPSSKDSPTNSEKVKTEDIIIERERDPLSPTTILPPPSYKEACQFLLTKGEEVKKKVFTSQFEKNILLRRSSLLRQNSIRYKKGDPRSILFLSKQSRSLSREGVSKLFRGEEGIKNLDKTVYNKSIKLSKSFNKIEENNLLSDYKTSKHTISTSVLEKGDCFEKNLDKIYCNLSDSLKSIDSVTDNSLFNNIGTMESSNVLSQQQESNFIIESHSGISLNDGKDSLLNQEILQSSKEGSFDFDDVVESTPVLYGPSFSLSKISENTDSMEEPVDIAPKFHTVKERSCERRGSLSIFGVTPHRRGRSEDNTFMNKDKTNVLPFDNDQEVFLANNPLESVENVAIRDRSKNGRDVVGSSRESKCKSQFLTVGNYGIQCLSKSSTDLTDLETSKESELEFTKELETSCDDINLPVIQSTTSLIVSKNDKKDKKNNMSKRHDSLKEFNLTEKEKELEENCKINKLKKPSTKSTKFRLTSSISKAKSNDKGSKGILGSLFGGKKKSSKPSLQGIFPNSGLGSKTISEATFESINQSCNLIVGDQKKSSTLPIDVMKTKSQVSFTTTDVIMGRFY